MTASGLPTEGLGPPLNPFEPPGGLPPGSLVAGRYRLQKLLGRGGFGAVYQARDERLERSVALKVMHRVRGGERDDVAVLLREARTIARLDHPHIVPVYDAGVEERAPWIASRLIAGRSLREALRDRGPLVRESALRLLLQAASALAHAHERGIVHRDVKPENLLLETRDGGSEHLWITDFGIAKLLYSVTDTSERLAGTPAYMAPEQVTGKRVDERTDVFALGCVAAEILTGKRLMDGASVPEVVHAIVHVTPDLAEVEEKGGAEIAEVIRRCLAKSPVDRWQTMSDLAAALSARAPGGGERRGRAFAGWWPFRRRAAPVAWDRPVVAEGVRKQYGFGRPVLDGVDLSIERGTVYALLGRNGCGKTTFLRTLLGIYRRDGGRIALFGQEPEDGNPAILARVGFVPDTLALDESLRVREALDLAAGFYPTWDRAWCHHLLSRFDLPWEEKLRSLSRGMQTKVSLVVALAHRPELLVLDDPTLGLDAIVLAELVETLEEVVRQEGATALLASHNYDELEQVATHVGIFQEGKIEMSDRLESLRRRVREVSLTFRGDVPDLRTVRELRIRKVEGRNVTGWVTGGPETLETLRAFSPETLTDRQPSLRELFVSLLR